MIIYNVTVNIDESIHEEWLLWMKNVHIPDVMETGHFLENKICKILAESEGGVGGSGVEGCRAERDGRRHRKEMGFFSSHRFHGLAGFMGFSCNGHPRWVAASNLNSPRSRISHGK